MFINSVTAIDYGHDSIDIYIESEDFKRMSEPISIQSPEKNTILILDDKTILVESKSEENSK